MRQTIFVLTAFILTSSALAQKRNLQTDVQQMNLKGPVRSIREIEYTLSQAGNGLVKTISTERPSQNRLLEFDRNGNLIKEIWYNGDGKESVKHEMKYAKPGLIIEKQVSKNGYIDSRIVSTYDDNEYLKTYTMYDGGGMIQSRSEYSYEVLDDNSRVTLIRNENFPSYSHVVYNKDGTVSYTEWGKDKASAAKTYSYTYTLKKQVASKQYYSAGKPKEILHFEYDREGNVIQDSTTHTAFPTVKKYEYTYDIRGNYIKRHSSGGAGSTLVERKILYY